MRKDLTELVFILDRSGSMAGLEKDTIGGFNAMLAKQKQEAGEALVTTVLFDNRYELLHDRTNLRGVSPITQKEYFVGGSTALLDAIGLTVDKIVAAHKHTDENERPGHVLLVITTDGMENASRAYTADRVRAMIAQQKERYGWEFLFLGANIDAVETAAQYGIDADRAVSYHPDGLGTRLNYDSVSQAACCIRASKPIGADWKKDIERDFQQRKRR